jgi:hypothetical protein
MSSLNRTESGPKAKRQSRLFPGITEDSRQLGVTRGYLWAVLTHRMKSARLSEKYRILKDSQAAKGAMTAGHDAGWRNFYGDQKPPLLKKLSADFAALQNHSAELQNCLEKLGLQIVVVQFSGAGDSPVWNQPDVEGLLSAEIEASHAGSHDSSYMAGGQLWAFYHVSDLAKGLRAVKQALESRGLLDHARIFHIETEAGWRLYWPNSGELVVPSDS